MPGRSKGPDVWRDSFLPSWYDSSMPKLHDLFPKIKPYNEGDLKVSELHTIHYEECGNPKGKPLIFLHGGPGGGIEPIYPRYFNPKKWRIVLFDQRGCGKSKPHAELKENTTWDLVADIERCASTSASSAGWSSAGAGAARWHWPTPRPTPSAAKASSCAASSCSATRNCAGSTRRAPISSSPTPGRTTSTHPAEGKRRPGQSLPPPPDQPGPQTRLAAAKAWAIWEGATSKLHQDLSLMARFGKSRFAEAFARIECHYFVNRVFLRSDPAPRRRQEDPAHPRRHRPGPLRHVLPHRVRLGPAPRLARGRVRRGDRRRPFHDRARHPQRAHQGSGTLQPTLAEAQNAL